MKLENHDSEHGLAINNKIACKVSSKKYKCMETKKVYRLIIWSAINAIFDI